MGGGDVDLPAPGALAARFWRMVRVRFQADALSGEGARRYGGRWNRVGTPALYLAADHATAVSEFHQDYVIPGTLLAVDVVAARIIDLIRIRDEALGAAVDKAVTAEWARIARIEARTPPSWMLADAMIAAGADGALVPSAQHRGGTNLVLWRWGEAGGAAVRVIDPERELG